MIETLTQNLLIWLSQDDECGSKFTYFLIFLTISINLIYKIFYYLFLKKKDEIIPLFFYIIRVYAFFFCFTIDSACEGTEIDEFSWFSACTRLIVVAGVFMIAALSIDEIVYHSTFDISEVFNEDLDDGFHFNSRNYKHYYWKGVNLTVSDNNFRNLNTHQRYYWRSINLDHLKYMHTKFEREQKLKNYLIETNLLWDVNNNELIIKKANSNRLLYQNLEYLVKKNQAEKQKEWVYEQITTKFNHNRLLYSNLNNYIVKQEYQQKMTNNCIESSFKLYQLHNSIKFKLR